MDLINGRPTGSVRVSFGYMSTREDVNKFLGFIKNCFIDEGPKPNLSMVKFMLHTTNTEEPSFGGFSSF